MAKKDPHDDPKLPNIAILKSIRLKGKHIEKGSVVAKKDFPNKATWQNMVHMGKPSGEETDDPVKVVKPNKETKSKTGKSGKTNKSDESGDGNLPGT